MEDFPCSLLRVPWSGGRRHRSVSLNYLPVLSARLDHLENLQICFDFAMLSFVRCGCCDYDCGAF